MTKSSLVSSTTLTRKIGNTTYFTLCVDKRSDIANSQKDFPVLDFAISNDLKSWVPIETNITFDGKKYCGIVPVTSMTIFPVSLSRDWKTRNSIFANNKGKQKFIFFISLFTFYCFEKKRSNMCCLLFLLSCSLCLFCVSLS